MAGVHKWFRWRYFFRCRIPCWYHLKVERKHRWTALSVEESSLPGRSKNTLPPAWLRDFPLWKKAILARKTLLFVEKLSSSLDGGSSEWENSALLEWIQLLPVKGKWNSRGKFAVNRSFVNGPIIVENFEETGHSGPNLNNTKGYLCKGNASKTE